MVTRGWDCTMVTSSMGQEPLGPLVLRLVTFDWMVKEILITPSPGLPWKSFRGCSCTVIISGSSSEPVPSMGTSSFIALVCTLVLTTLSDRSASGAAAAGMTSLWDGVAAGGDRETEVR